VSPARPVALLALAGLGALACGDSTAPDGVPAIRPTPEMVRRFDSLALEALRDSAPLRAGSLGAASMAMRHGAPINQVTVTNRGARRTVNVVVTRLDLVVEFIGGATVEITQTELTAWEGDAAERIAHVLLIGSRDSATFGAPVAPGDSVAPVGDLTGYGAAAGLGSFHDGRDQWIATHGSVAMRRISQGAACQNVVPVPTLSPASPACNDAAFRVRLDARFRPSARPAPIGPPVTHLAARTLSFGPARLGGIRLLWRCDRTTCQPAFPGLPPAP
jgi:hypothetical protein